MTVTRGTSNGNESGSSEDRRRRKAWLLVTYAADTSAWVWTEFIDGPVLAVTSYGRVPHGATGTGWIFTLQPACRCYRCGTLLVFQTMTVDRIIPGCLGGTYRRNNIRPACSKCNTATGAALANNNAIAAQKKRANRKRREKEPPY